MVSRINRPCARMALLTGLGVCGPIAVASDTGLGGFALSMHEHLSQVPTDEAVTGDFPAASFESLGSDGVFSSATMPQLRILLRDEPSQGGADLRGSFFGDAPSSMDSRGFNQQGVDLGKRYEPAPGEVSVAPLPTAAWGGLALLGGLFGLRSIRRIRH